MELKRFLVELVYTPVNNVEETVTVYAEDFKHAVQVAKNTYFSDINWSRDNFMLRIWEYSGIA